MKSIKVNQKTIIKLEKCSKCGDSLTFGLEPEEVQSLKKTDYFMNV